MKWNKKLSILLFTIALTLTFASSAFADTYEPNDSRFSCPIIGPGGYLSYVSTSTDLDYFLYESGSDSGKMTILLTPPKGKDYALQIFNSSGLMIKWSTNSGDQGEAVTLDIARGTQYFIRVSSQDGTFDASQPYLLSLSQLY